MRQREGETDKKERNKKRDGEKEILTKREIEREKEGVRETDKKREKEKAGETLQSTGYREIHRMKEESTVTSINTFQIKFIIFCYFYHH